MKHIFLNSEEYAYLEGVNYIPDELFNKMKFSSSDQGEIDLAISEEDASDIRDLFGERLQVAGFDVNYEPVKEGLMLENLIDKFYF